MSPRTLLAFIKRDFLIEVSYRTSFVLQFFGIFFTVMIWYYIAGIVAAPPDTPGLGGVGYFSYVLVGLPFFHYLVSAMSAFSTKVRHEQMTGTLEAMLVTPTSTGTIVLGSALWDFLITSVRVAVYLIVGWFLGVTLRLDGFGPCLVVLGLTILSFAGIGILSAAFILYLKKGDPITMLVSSVSALMGGVFYPPEDMHPWLEAVSRFLPITYALRAIRGALLSGASFSDLLPDLLALALFAAVLLPLGIVAFRVAVRRARVEGSLVQY